MGQKPLELGVLCNHTSLAEEDSAWRIDGDPTEGALIVLDVKAGLDAPALVQALPRDDLIPFESQHRFMAILFILPTNGGEALTILAAIALGKMLPVTATQFLWVNMITAVTLALSLSLVFEPAESDVMRRRY